MNADYELILTNEAGLDDDGWALIAPFGEWPKSRTAVVNGRAVEQRFIQVLDNDSAAALLDRENGLFRRLKRALVGIPVYAGHPDLRDHAPETLANKAEKVQIGVVDKARLGERGIEAHFVLSPDGARAVENDRCKYPSALWLVQPIGNDASGAMRCRPFKLLSVGLTPNPNISGVESLANASTNAPAASNPNPETDENMKSLLIGWLAAQGIALANDATEQAVFDAVKNCYVERATNLTVLANSKTELSGKITGLENEKTNLTAKVTTLENEKTQLASKVTALENDVKGQRKARAGVVVDLVITQGRLAPADRAAKITVLENTADEAAFTAEAQKLGQAARVLRVLGSAEGGKATGALANELPGSDIRKAHLAAIEKHMEATGETDFTKAHNAVLEANPALKDAMCKPEGK